MPGTALLDHYSENVEMYLKTVFLLTRADKNPAKTGEAWTVTVPIGLRPPDRRLTEHDEDTLTALLYLYLAKRLEELKHEV